MNQLKQVTLKLSKCNRTIYKVCNYVDNETLLMPWDLLTFKMESWLGAQWQNPSYINLKLDKVIY